MVRQHDDTQHDAQQEQHEEEQFNAKLILALLLCCVVAQSVSYGIGGMISSSKDVEAVIVLGTVIATLVILTRTVFGNKEAASSSASASASASASSLSSSSSFNTQKKD